MKVTFLLIIGLLCTINGNLYADNDTESTSDSLNNEILSEFENSNLLQYYDNEFFKWNIKSGVYILNFQNQNFKLKKGISESAKKAFFSYEESRKHLILYDNAFHQYKFSRGLNSALALQAATISLFDAVNSYNRQKIIGFSNVTELSEQENSNLLQFFDTEMIKVTAGGLTLNNQIFTNRFNTSLKKSLILYNDSGKQYYTFQAKQIFGNIFGWGGNAAMLAGLIGFLTDVIINDGSTIRFPLYLGLFGGGIVSSITGISLVFSAPKNFQNSVNLYNRNKITEFTKR